jgi:hypothetical protein
MEWVDVVLVLSSVLPLCTERYPENNVTKTTQEIVLLDKGNATELKEA